MQSGQGWCCSLEARATIRDDVYGQTPVTATTDGLGDTLIETRAAGLSIQQKYAEAGSQVLEPKHIFTAFHPQCSLFSQTTMFQNPASPLSRLSMTMHHGQISFILMLLIVTSTIAETQHCRTTRSLQRHAPIHHKDAVLGKPSWVSAQTSLLGKDVPSCLFATIALSSASIFSFLNSNPTEMQGSVAPYT